jgi:hypothetical protein
MVRDRRWRIGCGWALAVASIAACGGASQGQGQGQGQGPAPSEIARVHKSRCGSCHMRVEPGERTRAQLEDALARHHKRVHLTDEQWAQMIDYLSPQ